MAHAPSTILNRSSSPLVAIVGRPNVGKSTLFNRIAGFRSAVVSEFPGTTRDRVTAHTVWGNHPLILVDTGGLDTSRLDPLSDAVQDQINIAVEEADVIVMLTDVETGICASDHDVADILRKSGRPIVLATNKVDNDMRKALAVDFYELGLGSPICLSAYHNDGIDDLMAQVIELFPSSSISAEIESDINIAIVGRTNVGKSMLVNSLTGDSRSIVSALPGTTRDALDTFVTFEELTIRLIDTAGIRRRGSIEPGIERYSVLRSVRAIDRSDIAIVVMEASELATSQDTHIAGSVLDAYKGMVLAVNKWDLAGTLEITKNEAESIIKTKFGFASHVPICFMSAKQETGISELIQKSRSVYSQWTQTLPRYELRRTVNEAVSNHPPATTGKRALKVYGVTQDATSPPSFTFYVNRSAAVHFSYKRYLETSIRNRFGFEGSPLRMRFIGRGDRNPGKKKASTT